MHPSAHPQPTQKITKNKQKNQKNPKIIPKDPIWEYSE